MTWHQFWDEPVFSYGAVAFLAFCIWVVYLFECFKKEYRPLVKKRPYDEKHPFDLH